MFGSPVFVYSHTPRRMRSTELARHDSHTPRRMRTVTERFRLDLLHTGIWAPPCQHHRRSLKCNKAHNGHITSQAIYIEAFVIGQGAYVTDRHDIQHSKHKTRRPESEPKWLQIIFFWLPQITRHPTCSLPPHVSACPLHP